MEPEEPAREHTWRLVKGMRDEEDEEEARPPPPPRTATSSRSRWNKLDATIPKMYCSMIHSSVVVAGGAEAPPLTELGWRRGALRSLAFFAATMPGTHAELVKLSLP